jgi:uncharacterized protein (DUF4213/DUF364 family)
VEILEQILADLRELKDFSSVYLKDFHVCSPFTVVLLSDGSVGSAGNYSVQNHVMGYVPDRVKENYAALSRFDPLLLETLRDDHTLVGRSLFTAILSALSQDVLNQSMLSAYGLTIVPTPNWHVAVQRLLRSGDTVQMIGYGGALPLFCTSNSIQNLHVCDFSFSDREYRDIAKQEIESFGFDLSNVTFCSDVSELDPFDGCDVYFITGSALCNDTMEQLLERSAGCREVIIQGPSCSVFPCEFFRRSATLVLTTRKSRAEFQAGGHAGDEIYDYVDQDYVAISWQGREA